MASIEERAARAAKIASVLRPLGNGVLSRQQAERAAQLLGVHCTTVYRLRRRFLADPVASTLEPRQPGRATGGRLDAAVECVIDEAVHEWLPDQRHLAHPATDLVLEVKRRCSVAGLSPPSRSTIARRWLSYREQDALARAALPNAAVAPGTFQVRHPLDIVQVDHTQADILLVSELDGQIIGRPWLSVALDVATRCVLGFYVAMERPGAATVSLLLSRVVLRKEPWLERLGVEADWPMRGIPRTLHLDNAAEFKSRALRSGCREYGIELMYRPVGKPHFGGHIERLNRTLMERVRGLPGSTGSSVKGRKARQAEKTASLTLKQFEQWLAVEIGRRYHCSPHRGLLGLQPAQKWQETWRAADSRCLPAQPDAELKFLIRFLPVASRTIQRDGLKLFLIRYWHPLFAAWRETRRSVTIRYHPEDLSRIFVSAGRGSFVEVRYADLRRPPISLFEQRAALRAIRARGQRAVSEREIFETVEQQRQLVVTSQRATRARRRMARQAGGLVPKSSIEDLSLTEQRQVEQVNYDAPVTAYDVEQW
ncbi:Mu transposase C-terminal domain-containing protein [Burkholderia cepacia]|uniref:Mu transposase C-terminal domain-containing protein n=3 Tax=Burkholderia cepacia complex TaxID=87882 RepID=UPI00163B2955|nr:Mu transposase C-terminal domain-containing protein [Burkholderia cepacia]MCA8284540.1 Mu transposase C-terminal domain-containing protein [Burkholderia cepacia]HDR9162051.1 DDE-type integrase/transposase/recombinase [Burkholderia vietnamiensis]